MDEYIGMVKLFAGNFAPANYAFCDGSEMPITADMPLFSIIGTTYGGNGTSTFKLPNMDASFTAKDGTTQTLKYIICLQGMFPPRT